MANAKSPDIHSQKIKLEVQKLKLEINELRLSWWKRPAYALPLALATLGFLSVYHSGYFSDQRNEIARQTAALIQERDELAKKLSAFDADVKNAKTAYRSVIYGVVQATFRSEINDIPTSSIPLANVLESKYSSAFDLCQYDAYEWLPAGQDTQVKSSRTDTYLVALNILKGIDRDLKDAARDQKNAHWQNLLETIISETSAQKYDTLNSLLLQYKGKAFDKQSFNNRYYFPVEYYTNICIRKIPVLVGQNNEVSRGIREAFAARNAVPCFLAMFC